jgi:hypothetical protein
MIFLFPKKEIVLDCFTEREYVIETAPILQASRNIPKWWHSLPSMQAREEEFYPKMNMKQCSGFVDYYKHSICIPLWTDLDIKVSGFNYQWQFADGISVGETHKTDEQAKGFFNDYGHLKLISPWMFKTKEKINWIWSHPVYNSSEKNFQIKFLPGIINFYNQKRANINILIPLKDEKLYKLKHGESLIHLTPMSDKKVKIIRHLIDKKEMDRMIANQICPTFLNRSKNRVKLKEKFSDCPYHKTDKVT